MAGRHSPAVAERSKGMADWPPPIDVQQQDKGV